METFKKNNVVLLTFDFSEYAEFAKEHAIGMAKHLGYALTFLVMNNKDLKQMKKTKKIDDKSINANLQILVEEIEKTHNIKTNFLLVEGTLVHKIGEVVKEIGANIVLMGTPGKLGVQHLFGSTAIKIIIGLPIPVVAVQRSPFKDTYQNIVFPIDESMESKQKAKWAIHIARKFGSTIHIYGRYQTDTQFNFKIKNNMAQIKRLFEDNNIKCTINISDKKGSNFAKQTIKYAELLKADMIMIMTNPDKILPSFFLGEWDEQVIFNKAQIPVMCINPVDLNIQVVGM